MVDYGHVSPFVECQAIVAAEEGDEAELGRLIATMHPGEQARLHIAAQRLIAAITKANT